MIGSQFDQTHGVVYFLYFCLWNMVIFKGKFKAFRVIILGILIISDMWSVDKRYLNETHFVKERNVSIKPSPATEPF